VISSVGDEAFYDSTKYASIPIVMVFDRTGKLVETFKHDSKKYGKAGFSYAKHIGPLVDSLVSSPNATLAN
jgi:hypothetical protein